MKILTVAAVLMLFIACVEDHLSRTRVLLGNWKTEGKGQYEEWELAGQNTMVGRSYKLENGQKIITETLSITVEDERLVYEATVPNQNQGNTVVFVLNTEIKSFLSFENIAHDFPKKIQYKSINEDEIEVFVLGAEDVGFSYRQFRQ